jgi:hypothetical protein
VNLDLHESSHQQKTEEEKKPWFLQFCDFSMAVQAYLLLLVERESFSAEMEMDLHTL